jgi:uncharacterized protein
MPTALRRFRPFPHPVLGGLLVLALLGAGCNILPQARPDPTRHYVLTGPAPAELNPRLGSGDLRLGLRTVQVAPYLDSKSMLVRRGDNQIVYRDYARWAEPLEEGVGRMLIARLLQTDRVERVFPQPFPFDMERDYDLAVSVLRAEGLLKDDGTAETSLWCSVMLTQAREGAGHGEVIWSETFVAPPVAWKPGDDAALARALSLGVAALAERVAEKLPELASAQPDDAAATP